ncbi:hypothetical protein GWK47_009843 [Chionoecetes opilio]|uniref:Uncharacterized protein n=1 Tax=Chionoecetes opilio TaxID=41210 RepID=A0A8J5CNE3_CHIOP|nr:hypothetical protein GWK47_009843 [Chionoecetes opilio]
MFTFRIKYLKGDTNCAADALSRYPILSGGPEGSDEDDEELVCAAMTAATAAAAEDEVGHVVDLHQVEEEAARDEEYRLLRECVANDGWAERKDWEPLALRQYFKMRRHLSCQGNIVLYTCDEKPAAGHTCGPEACSPHEPSCGAPGQGLNATQGEAVSLLARG